MDGDRMSGFYKRTTELLNAPNSVDAPDYTLSVETKDDHNYPVDGWHWFDTEEEAIQFFGIGQTASISPRQAKLALLEAGLLDAVEAAVAASSRTVQIYWTESIEFHRNDPVLTAMAAQLGLTSTALDELFTVASQL